MIQSSKVAGVVLLSVASSSMAGLIPTAQIRTVAGWGFREVSLNAPGFGPWSDYADSDLTVPTFGSGWASQTSDINELRLTATASLQAARGNNAFSGRARSQFSCNFDVDSSLDYTLNGDWTARHTIFINGEPSEAFMKFERLSPNPEVLYFSQFSIDFTDPKAPVIHDSATVAMSGVLSPGQYRLNVVVDRREGLNGSISNGSFNVDLQVPGPASAIVLGGAFLARRRRR
jgi:hypothetical protein